MDFDKTKYSEYVDYITGLLKKEEFYSVYAKNQEKGTKEASLIYRHNDKQFDMDWVEAIEECIISLDTIVRNPRKFIVIEEDIIDISLAKSITTESVKHLAQHTNLISSVKDDMVLPNKILNTSKEESFEVYENRFIYTLLVKLRDFIAKRYDLIKKAYASDEMVLMNLNSSFNMGKSKMLYKLDLISSLPTKEVEAMDSSKLSNLERVAKMNRIVGDFLGSPFAKQMVASAPIRPPIQRTNVILKNQDFKKALVLWQFIETYNKMGFYVENKDKVSKIDNKHIDKFLDLAYLNTLLFESIVSDSNIFEDVTDKADDVLMDTPPEKQKAELAEQQGIEAEEANIEKETEIEAEKEAEAEEKEEEEASGKEETEEKDEEGKEEITEEETKEIGEGENEGILAEELKDDFPELIFDLTETRNIYERNSEEPKVTAVDAKKTTTAIDRILLAKKIEDAKEKQAILEKLQAKQKKEEEKLRKLTIAERLAFEHKQVMDEKRRQQKEARELKERIRLEKQTERIRLAEIREKGRIAVEEEKRLAEERLKEEKRNEDMKIAKERAELWEKERIEKAKILEEQRALRLQQNREAQISKLKMQEKESLAEIRKNAKEYMLTVIEIQKNELSAYKELLDGRNSEERKSTDEEIAKLEKKSKIIFERLEAIDKELEEMDK